MIAAREAPSRGDVVWLRFNEQSGHEQAGHWPALILSPQRFNERSGVALTCPITSRSRDWPFEVQLPPNDSVTGVVLADQIRSLDWRRRNAKLASRAPRAVVAEVLAKVRLLLD